jgi:hypothetical protein
LNESGFERQKGVAIFVRFNDKVLACAHAGVGSQARYHAANNEGGIEAGLQQRQRRHPRHRRLAVRPGDGDEVVALGQFAEEVRAAHHRDVSRLGRLHLYVVLRYGGRGQYQVRVAQSLRRVADGHGDPFGL